MTKSLWNPERIAFDELDGFDVSTVRLDTMYETMVFRNNTTPRSWADLACERYGSREAAIEGHAAMVERVKAGEFAPRNAWLDIDNGGH